MFCSAIVSQILESKTGVYDRYKSLQNVPLTHVLIIVSIIVLYDSKLYNHCNNGQSSLLRKL
jgi:hypothetical protein